jgi:GT2 family glycosyltransferase
MAGGIATSTWRLVFRHVRYINSGGNVGFGVGNVRGFQYTEEARYYFALNRDTM